MKLEVEDEAELEVELEVELSFFGLTFDFSRVDELDFDLLFLEAEVEEVEG